MELYFIITKKQILTGILAIGVVIMSFAAVSQFTGASITTFGQKGEPYYVAIIIDDFGNKQEGAAEFLALDIPFTGAVMPSMPYTEEESDALGKMGKDVILHMPMEAHDGKPSWLGDNALTTDLSPEELANRIDDSISQIHHIVGINNHMGSKGMESELIVTCLLDKAKEYDLLVVDSKTTSKSPIGKLAEEYNVTLLNRDVFLDGTKDQRTVEKNLDQALAVAKKKGYCIAIGHVGQAGGIPTVRAIENKKQKMMDEGVEFVTITELAEIIWLDSIL